MTSTEPIIVEGKEFPNLSAACRHYNMKTYVVKHRLKVGWPLDEALKTRPMTKQQAARYNQQRRKWKKHG